MSCSFGYVLDDICSFVLGDYVVFIGCNCVYVIGIVRFYIGENDVEGGGIENFGNVIK